MYKTRDGIELYVEEHIVPNAKAALLFTHGYAEHIGRYEWMFDQFNQAGLNVIAYDQRGHGKSGGEQAYIDTFDQYTSDMDGIAKNYKSDLPYFLMAHSMGGLVSVKYLIDHQPDLFKGFISSAGAYKVDPNLSPLLQKISGVIAKIAPRLKTIKLDENLVSSIPSEVEKYKHDPLNYHDGTKAKFGAEMLSSIKYVRSNAARITLPCLFMHGSSDKLIDPEGCRFFFDNVSSKDKEMYIFENAFHEIMREPEKQKFVDMVVQWVKNRL